MEKLRLNMELSTSRDTTKEELYHNTLLHQLNVRRCLNLFIEKIEDAIRDHDHTKVDENSRHINDDFYNMLVNKEKNDWWKMHQNVERHHLTKPEYVQEDVNLIDVIEMIADGFSAGVGRKGFYENWYGEFDKELLLKAFNNTIKLLEDQSLEVLGGSNENI